MIDNINIFENFLSTEECGNILNKCKEELTLSDAKVYNNNSNTLQTKTTRKSSIGWISDLGFLNKRLTNKLRETFNINGMEVTGIGPFQFTEYNIGEYYGWHNDAGLATQYKPQSVGNRAEGLANDFVNENIELVRKLSFSLQLSSPDDYEGGNVQLLAEDGSSYIAPRKRGTIVLFDSRTQHRVLKVTKGTRKSIVGWVVGKRWS